jgi:ring-1,2-phenylacetyl-CoA epoxidase subunit PaaE
MSMLKQRLHHDEGPCYLLHVCRRPTDAIFASELAALRRQHPTRFAYQPWFTRERGRPSREHLPELWVLRAAQGADARAYLCGPNSFMQITEQMLRENFEFAPDRIHQEFFEPSETGPARGFEHSVVAIRAGAETEFSCASDETFIVGARRRGVTLPSACEHGKCGTCVARLLFGEVRREPQYFLNARETADGWILCCRSKPASARCGIEFPQDVPSP